MPPKKDAFADLFQSASTSRQSSDGVGSGGVGLTNARMNKLSLAEREKLQQQGSQSSNPPHSSWSDLDILSPQPRGQGTASPAMSFSGAPETIPSPSVTPQSNTGSSRLSAKQDDNDPFDIFMTSKPQPQPQSRHQPQVQPRPSNGAQSGKSLLDDDDFIDVFSEPEKPKPSQQSQSTRAKPRDSASDIPSRASTPRAKPSGDEIIAELVNIGFDIEQANESLRNCGPNLQSCVNYIISNGSKKKKSGTSYDDSVLGPRPEGINFNGLGNDIYRKAGAFFNFSKNKIMDQIDQFGGAEAGVPAWMKNQAKHRKNGDEQSYGGGGADDDDEDMDRVEIERVVRLQREKERARLRERLDARNQEKIGVGGAGGAGSGSGLGRNGNGRSSDLSASLKSDASRLERSQDDSARPDGSGSSRANLETVGRPSPRPSPRPSTAPSPSPAPPGEPVSEVDLIGISSSTQPPSTKSSSLRDSTPLNQFIQTDYTTNKTKASQAYTTGDYTLALELYGASLTSLPPRHELRIVINSNLALINKLSGHLKPALVNVEDSLSLMSLEECNDSRILLSEKPIKYWYVKLVSIQAEALELMEKYQDALDSYTLLIQKLGCMDKKIMDGMRRVDKIVNPQNYKPVKPAKPQPAKPARSQPVNGAPSKPKSVEEKPELDPLIKDQIESQVETWSKQRNNELRKLLADLHVILPITLANDKLLHLQSQDLVLPKQVKIQYMKVISSIHPDKLASRGLDPRVELVCKFVFIKLNETWDAFRKEENI
ncbi:uncharacterized protein LODBEIA_P18520 [Lodderomyces beijingensis]|uniref:UBA domain-containing protein n=1 Tax=Lodderomyces beijingensis TaxID=1775926 RepID=A0ABP0ZHJ6_9ASCO